jgi:hypothetical protein
MAVNSQHELMLALERAQYATVLETPESDYLDFKEGPYQLQEPHQKWQLAKDVAAFANSRGGLIVVGYRTARPANALVEQAVAHRPVPKALVNWDAIRQVLASWIYPPLERVTPYWFPADLTINTGVFVIDVPSQADAAKYFVVREIDRPDGDFPGAIGIPVRKGDVVSWLRPEAIHHLLRDGLAARRGGALVAAVDQAALRQTEQRRVEGRSEQLETRAGWAEVPFIAFHAMPMHAVERPDEFYGNQGLRRALEEPDVLRAHGFHIRTEATAEVQTDGALAAVTDRRAVWLSPDGFFSAGARADADFFGWYVNEGADRPLAINPRVLTEFTFEFARFFHAHLRALSENAWSLWLSLVGMDRDGGVVLVPPIGGGGEFIQHWRGRPGWVPRHALQPTMHRRMDSVGDAGRDAYRLLVELYACFGFPPNEIPFVQNGAVSEQLLLAGMRR